MADARQIILDTDIGTDVDDLMALALLLGDSDVDLIGITTVYGDTRLRAQLTARILATGGWDIPIHAGSTDTISGREVWWAGHEGALHADLESERYVSDDAVRFLVDKVSESPGTIDIIAIGPLTNIARAIVADAGFAASVRHLWVMGGSFGEDEPEHNFRSDAAAARVVFGSGIPTTVTGLEVTRRIHIGETELQRIATSGALGRLVQSEIEQWWKFWDATWNVPHDPVTVLTLTNPELFRFSPWGTVTIDEGEDEGASHFAPDGGGRTRITTELDAPGVAGAIVQGIVDASSAGVEPR